MFRTAQQRTADATDAGFSMIELLVVIIIIGVLAAIAIPVFLSQRDKGYDVAVKSDLVAAANAEEAYSTDFNTYTDSASQLKSAEGFKFSQAGEYSGGTPAMTIVSAGSKGYCITATAASGNTWFYDSNNGGLQPLSTSGYTCSVSGAS
ncbi:MAG TPA: prepilin-type N-terminal cleavage/methylation domain-containing protein [Mycobacteriales bacterium]|nr:prepilin-type N-terminal cleavage/methylation domain-containing protein [Mycobacteriales bacterium]